MTTARNGSDSAPSFRMTRRELLVASIGVSAGALLASAPAAVFAQSAPSTAPAGSVIRIGVLSAFTGVFSGFGSMQRSGYLLALDQANNTAGGRPIRLIEEDDQLDNALAVTKAKKLVQQDNVDVLTGLVSGDEGLSVGDYMKETGIPVVPMYSASEDMTMRLHSPNIVRPTWTGAQPMDVFGYWLATMQGFKKIYMIGEDYSYPYNQAGGFKRGFYRGGGTDVKTVWHPVPTDDYSSIIASIPLNQGYDAVLYNGAGADAIAFTKQYVDLGMDQSIRLVGQSNTFEKPDLNSEPTAVLGGWSAQLTADNLDTPEWNAFKSAYAQKWNQTPSTAAEFAYTCMRMILRAIDSLNGDVSNKQALVNAMVNVNLLDAPRGPVTIDTYNAAVENVYIRQVAMLPDGIGNQGLYTVRNVSQFGPYEPQTYLAQKPDNKDYPPDTAAAMPAEMLTAATAYEFLPFGA